MSDKEIQLLSEFEHIRLRPQILIGSIAKSNYSIPILNSDGIIEYKSTDMIVGFYKLFLEILDNAIDEAKRTPSMKKIIVKLNTSNNLISIRDTGGGFYKGTEINKKSGINNIKTALSKTKAGSNFKRSSSDSNLIGMNGVGASVVNMLSDYFKVNSITKDYNYTCVWEDFNITKEETKKYIKSKDQLGTTIEFIPLTSMFKDEKWDIDILKFIISSKQFIIKNTEDNIKKLSIDFFVDNHKVEINYPLIPKDSIVIQSNIGLIAISKKYDNSEPTGFINSARCQGIFQKIVHDKINSYFNYSLSHHFYNTLIIMNFHPSVVEFGDQNKTRFETARHKVEHIISSNFFNKLDRKFKNSDLFYHIEEKVNERVFNDEVKKIKKTQKVKLKTISKKYTSATKKFETLYISEGLSAGGSILQKRNSLTDGVYTLKGKIKNCRTITDLSSNDECIELMSILGLKVGDDSVIPKYDKIVIATDYDPDGVGHICTLLINFFNKWFPNVIEGGHLYLLETPLLSIENNKTKKYFYNLSDKAIKNIKGKKRYLKGLGSLTLKDWEYVMNNKKFIQFVVDKNSDKMLDMAFGTDSKKRKNWLKR